MILASALNLKSHDVVSFVGGGGKTTSILRLGWEFTSAEKRAIITTTTRMGADQDAGHQLVVIGSRTTHLSPEMISQIQTGLSRNQVVVVVGEAQAHKTLGVHPDVVSDLAPMADGVFVEADGARSRPFKAPAPYEPVWPSVTTVAIAVIGIDAVGARLDASFVHRPEYIAAITGLTLGGRVTVEAIVSCVLHADGLFARVPPQAQQLVLINKVKTHSQLDAAQQIAAALASPRPELRTIIADVKAETVKIWP